jgi:hypothetical protein
VRVPAVLATQPSLWPRFSSTLRSTAVTARLGRILGIAFVICFVTGLLSHYQYEPWTWLPIPAAPYWGYRLSQGVHVITGIACIPLILAKLWSVYHRLFLWPPVKSFLHSLERLSVAVLVGSSVLQLITGLLNILQFYPWPWSFVGVHHWLSYVIIGSLALHIAIQLPAIREGLATPIWKRTTDIDPSATPSDGPSRRGVLVATGAGVGVVALTTVGQVFTPLEPLALLAPRNPSKGPQSLPVNRTAAAADVLTAARSLRYRFTVAGPTGFELTVAQLEALDTAEEEWPIACVEGWSRMAHWRGPRLLDLVTRAGGNADSTVTVVSLEKRGYRTSHIGGSQLARALLATHLNGERLSVDHGYPLRLIAPDRAGVLNTKWLTKVVFR